MDSIKDVPALCPYCPEKGGSKCIHKLDLIGINVSGTVTRRATPEELSAELKEKQDGDTTN